MANDEPLIQVAGLKKYFRRPDGGKVAALNGFDLQAPSGEFVVMLGPSGCGKTTALRSLAGLERIDDGEIRIGGRAMADATSKLHVPAHRRNVGMVFQSYALWPHMTVLQNVAYPLKVRGGSRDTIEAEARKTLSLVHCEDFADRLPSQLSGGQQQRIALARALVGEPDVVLFDEPLSNLDAKLRGEMRFQLRELHREIGFTALYVTHDQAEALSLGTILAVVDSGSVAQVGPPRDVYRAPVSPYVAEFLGASNEISLDPGRDGWHHEDHRIFSKLDLEARTDATLVLRCRPSAVSIMDGPASDATNVSLGRCVVEEVLPEGDHAEVQVDLRGTEMRMSVKEPTPVSRGSKVQLGIPITEAYVFDAAGEVVPVARERLDVAP